MQFPITTKPMVSPTSPRHLRDGFTVIEMLVALALSSMLLIGLMSIVNLFGVYEATLANEFPEAVWQMRLQQQIRTDITNSREYQVSPNKLELIGYASKDFVFGEAELLPSSITYRITELTSGRPCLVRSESHYTSSGQVVWRNELMAFGFMGIQFDRTENWGAVNSLQQTRNRNNSPQSFARISDRMTLIFYAAENTADQQDWVIPVILR